MTAFDLGPPSDAQRAAIAAALDDAERGGRPEPTPPIPRQESPMPDAPPDRLSNDPRSPYHDAAALERGVGVRFNGEEKTNVEEYCVSEGWVRLPFGKTLDRRGNPMTVKVKGTVEPWFKDAG